MGFNASYIYEKEREENFMRLWNMNLDIVQKVLRKYEFIQSWEYDDYRQEVFIHTWEKFYRWMLLRGGKIEFEQWLFMEARAAAYAYRARLLKKSSRGGDMYKARYIYREDMEMFVIQNENYSEDHLISLRRAVNELNPNQKEAVELFLSEEDLSAASLEKGQKCHHYSSRLSSAKRWIRDNKDKFFEDMPCYIKPKPQMSRGIDGDHHMARKVQQIDPVSLCVVKTWDSAAQAERVGGFSSKNIYQVATAQKTLHKGFRWLYVGETDPNIINKTQIKNKKKPVLQLTPNGDLVQKFEGVKSVEDFGFSSKLVCDTLKGRRNFYKGCRWVYATD
jgi:DNA-directed RNA polymerase specialized sigma24 family protein